MADDDILKSVQQMVDTANVSTTDTTTDEFFKDFFLRTIHDINTQTIAINYDAEKYNLSIQAVKGEMNAKLLTKKEFQIEPKLYNDFCQSVLKLDINEKYNTAASVNIDGTICRVFAIMKPYTENPEIVISTLKEPPKILAGASDQQQELLDEIMNSNQSFLVAGKSGSGKSYLLNFMLDNYYPEDKRVILVEEFDEIVEPNPFTTKLLTPPTKPTHTINHLKFLTEEAQLMRADLMVVGEVKGDETFSFVLGAASGTCSVATIHGSDPRNALQRLTLLCTLAQPNLNPQTINSLIAKAIKYLIMVEKGKITSINELVAPNNGNFSLKRLDGMGL